jgi:hypothetical protein
VSEDVDRLGQRLRALDGEPLAAHPGALDAVHRGLVAELDHLAGAVAGEPRPQPSGSFSTDG